jgi:uncharacterized protein
MPRLFTAFAALILSASFMHSHPSRAQSGPIEVMILDGQSGGSYHQWKLTTPVLKKELEETGLFHVTVVTAPPAGSDLSAFNPEFKQYQVVVSNYDAPEWPAGLRSSFEDFVRNGGGFVAVHAADNAFADWPAYNQMIGIGGWRGRTEKAGPLWYWQDGKQHSDNTPGPAGHHGNRLPFQVVSRAPGHPILQGLPPIWMHGADELYGTLRGPGENMAILATAHSDARNQGTGHEEPMIMALTFGRGRIVHTTLGHDIAAMSCVGFITIFQRGTEWAATGKVTQKPPANFPTASSTSLRVDIEEMDPAFLNGASDPVIGNPAP